MKLHCKLKNDLPVAYKTHRQNILLKRKGTVAKRTITNLIRANSSLRQTNNKEVW